MMPKTALATPDEPGKSRKTGRKNQPKLRGGVVKRGRTWSYVIRVTDPETGVSKPKWVGGFATEEEAKAARDEARVKARRGEYVDRNTITVAEYLDEWLDAHAVEIKPKTLQDYRHLIERHVKPQIGGLRLQAVRPARITKLYRDLLTGGGRNGAGLSSRTVAYVHAVLRKAFGDAVLVDQILASNPVERAKRPRMERAEPGKVWTSAQLRAFLSVAEGHRLFAFYHVAVLRVHRKRQAADQLEAGESWKGARDNDYVFTTALGEPVHPDTVSSLMTTLIRNHNDPKEVERPVEQLPHARLHDLRHIHATTLLLAGVAVHVVAARLGHADPAITLRVYAHVINQQLVEAADIFAKRIADAA